MTDQTKGQEAARLREFLEIEQKAKEQALTRSRNGVLGGTWERSRLVCRTCGHSIVHPNQMTAFLDVAATFDSVTIAARSIAAYDLKFRKSIDIPDWVSADSELWRPTPYSWADHKLDDIIMSATVTDGVNTYDEYSRVCDGASHVFIRACSHCPETDPLNLRAEFLDLGMERAEPPHDFLDALRDDQDSRQTMVRARAEHILKNGAERQ